MSAPQQAAKAVGEVYTVGYVGVTIGGMSLPDWAAALAIATSVCLLIQYGYRFSLFVRRKLQDRWNKRVARDAKARAGRG